MGAKYPAATAYRRNAPEVYRKPVAMLPRVGSEAIKALPSAANDQRSLPRAANYNRNVDWPFRRVPEQVRTFGRKLPAELPRGLNRAAHSFNPQFISRINPWLLTLDIIEATMALRYVRDYDITWPDGPPGWTHQRWNLPYPYAGAPTLQELYTFHSGPYPLVGQYYTANHAPGDPVPGSCNQMTWQRPSAQNPVFSGVTDAFSRLAGDPSGLSDPVPELVYGYLPGLAPNVLPNVDPAFYAPGQAPEPEIVPFRFQPYRQHNPWLSPTEQTWRGNDIDVDFIADGIENYPTFSIEPGTETLTKTEPQRDPYIRRPPERKQKERKTIANIHSGSVVGQIIGQFTEGLDNLGAVYNALPKKVRDKAFRDAGYPKHGMTPTEKAWVIYRNWKVLDVKQAIINIAKDQVQDMLIAGVSKRITKNLQPWYRLSKRPVGLTTGPAI